MKKYRITAIFIVLVCGSYVYSMEKNNASENKTDVHKMEILYCFGGLLIDTDYSKPPQPDSGWLTYGPYYESPTSKQNRKPIIKNRKAQNMKAEDELIRY